MILNWRSHQNSYIVYTNLCRLLWRLYNYYNYFLQLFLVILEKYFIYNKNSLRAVQYKSMTTFWKKQDQKINLLNIVYCVNFNKDVLTLDQLPKIISLLIIQLEGPEWRIRYSWCECISIS